PARLVEESGPGAAHGGVELLAAVLGVAEHVEARAAGREETDVAGFPDLEGACHELVQVAHAHEPRRAIEGALDLARSLAEGEHGAHAAQVRAQHREVEVLVAAAQPQEEGPSQPLEPGS